MAYTILNRRLTWDGKAGEAHYGNTEHRLTRRPHIGVDGMVRVEYTRYPVLRRIWIKDGEERDLTLDECLGIEDRLYAMDRGAGDPWGEEWGRKHALPMMTARGASDSEGGEP